MSDVTGLLEAIGRGEPERARELVPIVYEELRRLAEARLAREPTEQTLQATAWSMRPTSGWSAMATARPGRIAATSSPPPTRCDASSWRRPGASVDCDRGRAPPRRPRPGHCRRRRRGGRRPAGTPRGPRSARRRGAGRCRGGQAPLFRRADRRADRLGPGHLARTANRHWAYARAWLYGRLNPTGDASA